MVYNIPERVTNLLEHLSSVGRCDGLRNACNLAVGTDYLLSSRVAHVRDVFILPLSPLPDLDLCATPKDTDAHG